MLNHFIKETGYNRKTQRKSASKVKVKTTDGTQMTPPLDFISVVSESCSRGFLSVLQQEHSGLCDEEKQKDI